MTQVLSMYPLTDTYLRELEKRVGQDLTPRVAAELRHPTLRETLSAFRSLRASPLVLAFEDPTSESLNAMLVSLGGLVGRGPIRVFDHDLRELYPGWMEVVGGLGRVVVDSISGLFLSRMFVRRLSKFEGNWQPVPWNGGGRPAYLKTNLWFGVKAGGSVGHVAGVINGLVEAGQRVELFANAPQPMVSPEVPLHLVRPPSLCAYPSELNLVRYQRIFSNTLGNFLDRSACDWIYQRVSLANCTGAFASQERKLPLVAEYNGSEVWVSKNWGKGLRNEAFAKAAEEAMLRQATLVVAVSSVLGEELLQRGIPEERVLVHPNCVDTDTYRPDLLNSDEIHSLRAKNGIAPDALVATFLGTFGAWHGIVFLANAWKKLYAEQPGWMEERKLHLLLVGDGALRKEAQLILEGIPRVTFTGLVPQSQAPGFLAASDIFLSPHLHAQTDTRFFGSPTKVFEYMAMGRPILGSTLEQMAEILSPGIHMESVSIPELREDSVAVVFKPGDEQGFLHGLQWLADNPVWRKQIAQNARIKVEKEFTWRNYVEHLMTRLNSLRG